MMNSYIIFCNFCYQTYLLTGGKTNYLVTSCGKVICQNCSTSSSSSNQTCPSCGAAKCSRKIISPGLDSAVKVFFKSSKEQLQNIRRVHRFQNLRLKQFEKYLFQKNSRSDSEIEENGQKLQELEKTKKDKAEKVAQIMNTIKQRDHQQQQPQQRSTTESSKIPEKGSKETSFAQLFKAGIEESSFDIPKIPKPTSAHPPPSTASKRKMNLYPKPQFSLQFDYKTPVKNPKKSKLPSIVGSKNHQSKEPSMKNNNVRTILSSTPIVGHEKSVQDFGMGNRPPSSIISSSSILFRQKREYIKKNF